MIKSRFLFQWLAIGLVAVSFALTAQAAGFGVAPKQLPDTETRSWFVYTMKPSETRSDTVVISNNTEKPISVILEGLDALNTVEGGFTLVDGPSKNKDLGTWINLEHSQVQVAPNDSAEVNFTLTVPSSTSVGQHSGAIVVYEKPVNQTGGVGLKIRVGARIYVTVPGKINRELTFDKVSHEIKDGKLIFNIQSTNKSNINIQPALDINLRGLFRTYRQEDNKNGTYLPGSVMKVEKTWQRPAPKMGYYRVNLVLHTWSVEQVSEDGVKTQLPDLKFTYSFGFWVGGWYMFGIALLIILGWLIFRFAVYQLDSRKYRMKVVPYVVGKGETIMHISEKTGIFPQQLTKFNQLKWPYSLNAGDKLMLPVDQLTPDELYRKRQTEMMPSLLVYLLSWRLSLYHPVPKFSASGSSRVVKRPVHRGRSSHPSRSHDSKH